MMALLCVAFAALAVWWGVPPPRPELVRGGGGRRPERPADPGSPGGSPYAPAGQTRSRAGPPLRAVLGGVGSVAALVVAAGLDGARGTILGLTALVLGWTVARLLRARRQARLVQRGRTEVARACAALAAQLRVGQVPTVALDAAAGDHPVLREARDAQELGGDVVRVWRSQAEQAGRAGLLDLARAWQVSARTGSPMSATLEQVAAALAAEQDLRSVVAGELSAPRATGKVMAVLPGCGVGLGYLLGGEPIEWLLAGPLGWGCLLAGAVLACLGVLWIEALARGAAA